jgi:RimJ/RimL family protein N-acetyltransferase
VVFAQPEIKLCIIDPAENNFAAIRAYKKAGFHHLGTVQAPGELEQSYVMMIRREELSSE